MATSGRNLPLRLQVSLDLAELQPGMKIVDIGCGRGEIVFHCAQKRCNVWGLDYSFQAVRIASDALKIVLSEEFKRFYVIQQSDARRIPLESSTIDRVFMLDVVEHLYPEELDEALGGAFRILKPGGLLIVHTIPNLWYYHFGYPVYRHFQALRGIKLPTDPRKRWAYNHVHVNEQTPVRLKKTLNKSGFKTRVFLKSTQRFNNETNNLVRWGMNFLTWVYPLRWIFCDDIFAIGVKPDENSR